jgi:hypothetical protein
MRIWVVGKSMRQFEKGIVVTKMFCIYQPPNVHVRISGILLSNTMGRMAAAAVKKIYCVLAWARRAGPEG